MDLTDLSDIMSDISAKKQTQTQKSSPVCTNFYMQSTTTISRSTLGPGDDYSAQTLIKIFQLE